MKIVIAIDESSHSEHLIKTVIRRKWPADTEFKVVMVIEPLDMDFQEDSWVRLAGEVTRRRKEHAEDLCQHARKQLLEHVEGAQAHFEIREGDPCCQLIDVASDWKADKILLGAHSKSVCPHNLLGSVSRAVSRHAPCSVEIVRDKSRLVTV